MPVSPSLVALITGASSGIGLAIAKLLVARGYMIVAVGSNQARLDEAAQTLRAAGGTVVVLVQDLSVPGAALALFKAINKQKLQIGLLVNDAGFATSGRFTEIDPDLESTQMQVNMVALTELTKLILPGMVTRGNGRVLNVASLAAFAPGPYMAVYYATKAYVLHLSEALARELRGTGVTVTALCPGPTASGFAQRAGVTESGAFSGRLPSADSVAGAGVAGMMAGKRIVIPGWRGKLLVAAMRFVPRALAVDYLARLQK